MLASKGTYFTKTKTPFIGARIDQFTFVPTQGSIIPPADQNKNVLPFITVLALMLEAEKSPVLIDHGSKKSKKRSTVKSKNKDLSAWIEKRIYIDAKLSYKTEKTVKDANTTTTDKTGKEKQGVKVHGFLRHQAYGPELSLRKWIYIEDHESSRWKKTGDKKITVNKYFKEDYH